MKRQKVLILLTISILVILACNVGVASPPPATEAPAEPSQSPAATETSALTEVPVASPTLEAIDWSVPPMEVGSKFFYVDGSVIVAVPGGEFVMGYGGEDDPKHTVNVSDFWIYRTKVTNRQYALCMQAGACSELKMSKNPGFEDPLLANYPVVGVKYGQAETYCAFVHGRLPTEAEWEKAARGPDGNKFPWGDATPNCELANIANCVGKETPVTNYSKGQSYYAVLDMVGNVYEWVADWYNPFYYGNSPVDDPTGPDQGDFRSIRSGKFDMPIYEVEKMRRNSSLPDDPRPDVGFRCVVDDPVYFAPYCEAAIAYGQDAFSGVPVSGDAASETCPAINIKEDMACQGTKPVTKITFVAPAGATIDPDGCGNTADPMQFLCENSGVISVQMECTETLPGGPACPPGYTLAGTACEAVGGQGGCLPGYAYDTAKQCCAVKPGKEALSVCPVGTYYVSPTNSCMPYPAQGIVSITKPIGYSDCKEHPVSPDGSDPCNAYTDIPACEAAGCTWVPTGLLPNYGYCY